jgi:hypothetical protein
MKLCLFLNHERCKATCSSQRIIFEEALELASAFLFLLLKWGEGRAQWDRRENKARASGTLATPVLYHSAATESA